VSAVGRDMLIAIEKPAADAAGSLCDAEFERHLDIAIADRGIPNPAIDFRVAVRAVCSCGAAGSKS